VRGIGGEGGVQGILDSPALRVLSDPFAGAALACALLLALYRSSLIEVSLSSSWVHLLVLLLAMTAGILLFWPVLGVDPAPGARSVVETVACVAGVVGCLGLLAAQLRSGDQLLAAAWFLELRWNWVDPMADQRVGGALAGAAAVGLVLLAAAPVLRTRSWAGSAPVR
jgi:putative copper resistance protein D